MAGDQSLEKHAELHGLNWTKEDINGSTRWAYQIVGRRGQTTMLDVHDTAVLHGTFGSGALRQAHMTDFLANPHFPVSNAVSLAHRMSAMEQNARAPDAQMKPPALVLARSGLCRAMLTAPAPHRIASRSAPGHGIPASG